MKKGINNVINGLNKYPYMQLLLILTQTQEIQARNKYSYKSEVTVKNRKPHHRQLSYHAYSTNIQASNQAIRDQKPIRNAQKFPK